jgi:hypothetical protein
MSDRLTAYERDLIAEIRRLVPLALASPDASGELTHMALLAARAADTVERLAAESR